MNWVLSNCLDRQYNLNHRSFQGSLQAASIYYSNNIFPIFGETAKKFNPAPGYSQCF